MNYDLIAEDAAKKFCSEVNVEWAPICDRNKLELIRIVRAAIDKVVSECNTRSNERADAESQEYLGLKQENAMLKKTAEFGERCLQLCATHMEGADEL